MKSGESGSSGRQVGDNSRALHNCAGADPRGTEIATRFNVSKRAEERGKGVDEECETMDISDIADSLPRPRSLQGRADDEGRTGEPCELAFKVPAVRKSDGQCRADVSPLRALQEDVLQVEEAP